MANRIAVLHFTAPPVVGGVESTIFHHCKLLSMAGWKVRIIAGRGIEFHDDIPLIIIPEVNSRHRMILETGKDLAKGDVNQDFYTIRDSLVEKLTPVLDNADACIVHNVHSLHKNLPLTAALYEILNKKTTHQIAWCHDFAWLDRLYIPQLHPGYPWELLCTAWPGVSYVTVSEHRRQRLSNLMGISPDEISVIPPGVAFFDFQKFSPLTRSIIHRLNLLNAEPVLLLPARITRRKNIEFAIQVIATMKQEYPKVALLITGPPGPHNPTNLAYLKSMRKLKKDLGVSKNVHFLFELGDADKPLELPDEVIADLYKLADALLFPSTREGFGIPVLEAGIARMPVFASDIPPVRESSKGYAELFNPSDDPADVGHAIVFNLKSNSAYQLRRAVLAEYTWESIVQNKVIPLVDTIIN